MSFRKSCCRDVLAEQYYTEFSQTELLFTIGERSGFMHRRYQLLDFKWKITCYLLGHILKWKHMDVEVFNYDSFSGRIIS